jgi:hypothetical protein
MLGTFRVTSVASLTALSPEPGAADDRSEICDYVAAWQPRIHERRHTNENEAKRLDIFVTRRKSFVELTRGQPRVNIEYDNP